MAGRFDIPCREAELTANDLAAADEIFLTSSPFCLLPATQLDGRAIGGGRPGETFRRLLAAWNDMAGIDIAGQAERFARR